MKTRIALGTGLLLTLSTAVAGTLMYGQAQSGQAVDTYTSASITAAQPEPTPEMIAMWRATAVTTDYVAPKVPI